MDIFKEIKKLNFPKDQFIVVGGSVMALKGIRQTSDLDIIVSEELFNECEKNGWVRQEWTWTGGKIRGWLKKDDVELSVECVDNERILLLDDLKKDAEIINGIYFMSLTQLIQFKKSHGRTKDFEDIKLIEDYLKKNESIF